jgi:hypothetical protein
MERLLLLPLSVNVTSMFRDPRLLPGVSGEGRPDAALAPLHPHLARRLFDRRGGPSER